jgi:hypothetical protein
MIDLPVSFTLYARYDKERMSAGAAWKKKEGGITVEGKRR